jgi:hypothetical protein
LVSTTSLNHPATTNHDPQPGSHPLANKTSGSSTGNNLSQISLVQPLPDLHGYNLLAASDIVNVLARRFHLYTTASGQLPVPKFAFCLFLELFGGIEAAVRQSSTSILDINDGADPGL